MSNTNNLSLQIQALYYWSLSLLKFKHTKLQKIFLYTPQIAPLAIKTRE